MAHRIRVLFAIGEMSGGGSQRQLVGILQRLDRQRFAPFLYLISAGGELLPEVKHLISELAKIRTVDSHGRMVLATGHATPEEHLMLAKEGRAQGLQVLLTHPGDIPQIPEVARLGATAPATMCSMESIFDTG